MREVANPWYGRAGRTKALRLFRSFERLMRSLPLRTPLSADSEESLCRYCVLFAYLDWIGRAPFGNSAQARMVALGQLSLSRMLSALDTAIVTDLKSLSSNFASRHGALIKGPRKAIVGRSMLGGPDVGGADFDLILGNCLWDLKTTLKPSISTDALRQVIGYRSGFGQQQLSRLYLFSPEFANTLGGDRPRF